MLKDKVSQILRAETGIDSVPLMTPKHPQFGDFSINVRQIQAKKPEITAEQVAEKLKAHDLFEKVDVVGNFINLFISKNELLQQLSSTLERDALVDWTNTYEGKKIIVEFAHPNTHKIFHVGHLRNISLGESISRILEAAGANVIRTNYQGDVGLHIAKCLYIIKKEVEEKFGGDISVMTKGMSLDEKITLLGKAYADGNTAYEANEAAKEEIHEINRQIYEKDPAIVALWQETRQWSLDYFDHIYKRVDTTFHRLFFESEVADRGLEVSKEALAKGILSESEGAVVLDGEKHGVDTRVFINSLGLPTYEGKELGLAELEFSEFGTIDQCIHVVGPEQKSFFQTTFKAQALLDPEKYEGKQVHYAYGFVDLKDGKMSSRKGNVLSGVSLLDDIKERVQKEFTVDDTAADVIAVGAVKYSFLKVEAQNKINFDINESISIQGNSGPYLQYTYARIQSLSSVIDHSGLRSGDLSDKLTPEDVATLRTLSRFTEVIAESAQTLSPHVLATYLYSLAQTFNALYEKRSFLKEPDKDLKSMRAAIASGTAETIKNGLGLLGINVLNKI